MTYFHVISSCNDGDGDGEWGGGGGEGGRMGGRGSHMKRLEINDDHLFFSVCASSIAVTRPILQRTHVY